MPSFARLLPAATLALGAMLAVPHAAAVPITIEQLLNIRHPSNAVWSPDGKKIAFLWNRCDVVNLYVQNADGSGQPHALTTLDEGHVTDVFWSADGTLVYFVEKGKLWKSAASGGQPPALVWAPPAGTSQITASPDRTEIAAAMPAGKGDHALVIRNLATGAMRTVTTSKGTVYRIRWSPDGRHLAYVGDGRVIQHDSSPSYSGAKLVFRDPEVVPGHLYVVAEDGGTPVAIAGNASRYSGVEWAGNDRLTYARVSPDFHDRSIVVADVADGQEHVIHTDHEQNFWSLPGDAGGGPLPSPDGRWIAYISDTADNWDHLFVIPTTGGTPIQLTHGEGESWRPAWPADSRSLAFDADTKEQPGDRHIGIVSLGADAAHPSVRFVTSDEGTNTEPRWSPKDSQLVYLHTDWQNSADFFTVASAGSGQPVRLTNSMPADLDKSLLVKPQRVTFPGADGTPVSGWLFVPKNLDKTKKHPAIVWIHGDGINQNYDGWHIERNYAVYYSFHQYLLQEGYVVFAPDYRGSIGYGSKWRSAVYMDVGGKDAEDASRAGVYLKTLSYVDPDRIGVWGLSYGGFFTLLAVTRHPTLFHSAVDVAGVVDYAMYYEDPYHGSWTESRIGRPDQNPKVYANASPISHIDQLQRPLLILAGTADVNVPFIETVRLIDAALRADKGNLLSFMMYPGEFHYFSREWVLRDAWNRVDRFFAATLQSSK